jgi:predicted ferric reductase
LVPQGLGSEYIKKLDIGATVSMMGPTGGFSIPDMEHELFFVAQGIGVAPFCSIVPNLLANGFPKQIELSCWKYPLRGGASENLFSHKAPPLSGYDKDQKTPT